MFGMQMKLVIPRGQLANLRRCIQAVSHISSEESISSLLPGSQMDETTFSRLSTSSTIKQSMDSRLSELSQLSVPSLKEVCRSYGLRTGGKEFHDLFDLQEESKK